jgi:hypothetical protein
VQVATPLATEATEALAALVENSRQLPAQPELYADMAGRVLALRPHYDAGLAEENPERWCVHTWPGCCHPIAMFVAAGSESAAGSDAGRGRRSRDFVRVVVALAEVGAAQIFRGETGEAGVALLEALLDGMAHPELPVAELVHPCVVGRGGVSLLTGFDTCRSKPFIEIGHVPIYFQPTPDHPCPRGAATNVNLER